MRVVVVVVVVVEEREERRVRFVLCASVSRGLVYWCKSCFTDGKGKRAEK